MDASEVNIIAVGAGQIGLMLAAVCKQMNIRALVIEQHERVGDIWRKRYPTLALHTTRRPTRVTNQCFINHIPLLGLSLLQRISSQTGMTILDVGTW